MRVALPLLVLRVTASAVVITHALSFVSCTGISEYPTDVTPHWEERDGHRMYIAGPDPRTTGEDRTSRVRLTDLDELRQYTLDLMNGLRRYQRRSPLELDPALNTFAQEGSIQLSIDHRPHAHFESEARRCDCGAEAENQGSPDGWPPGPPDTQITEMLRGMRHEGPGGGHYDALMSPEWTRVGVGILNPGSRMYFTTDFGR
jgi:hypothetical protein